MTSSKIVPLRTDSLIYTTSHVLAGLSCANAMPLALLQQELPKQSEKSDSHYFYLRCSAFENLCGDYSTAETILFLYQRNLLKCRSDSFTYFAKPILFGESRPEVFAINKSILEDATL